MKGRVAIGTGGATGIGKGFAVVLARKGVKVMVSTEDSKRSKAVRGAVFGLALIKLYISRRTL
jgi:NAD(P)-dependent dehydrogenase (short-subunit alcohol dehydrogenase family)